MSKVSLRKPTPKVSAVKPTVRTVGMIEIKSTRMIFDDSTYEGKYVFSLTGKQLEAMRAMEDLEFPNYQGSRSWSTNEYGDQLKVSGIPAQPKATYDLTLKVSEWSLGSKHGIGYKIVSAQQTEDLPRPPPRPLRSLGVCLI